MKLLWRLKWIVAILVVALIPVLLLLPRRVGVILSGGAALSLLVILVYEQRIFLRPLLRIRKGLEEDRVEEVLQDIQQDEEEEDSSYGFDIDYTKDRNKPAPKPVSMPKEVRIAAVTKHNSSNIVYMHADCVKELAALKKIRLEQAGDSDFLPGTLVDALDFEEINEALPEGEQLIRRYYDLAPTIVKHIDQKENRQEIYRRIWDDYLSECIRLIEGDELELCRQLYTDMVEELSQEYFFVS